MTVNRFERGRSHGAPNTLEKLQGAPSSSSASYSSPRMATGRRQAEDAPIAAIDTGIHVQVVEPIDRTEFWRDAEAANRLARALQKSSFIRALCDARAFLEISVRKTTDRPLGIPHAQIMALSGELIDECRARGLID